MFVLNHSNCVHTMNENKRLHSNNNNNICGCASVSSEKNGPRTPSDCDKKPIHTFAFLFGVMFKHHTINNLFCLFVCFVALSMLMRIPTNYHSGMTHTLHPMYFARTFLCLIFFEHMLSESKMKHRFAFQRFFGCQ